MRKLIRGLSSYEFEEAVLSAYDAMRGAGVRVEQLAALPTPAGSTIADIAATLRAIRRETLSTWNFQQRAQLEIALEGAERIVTAAGPLRALAAIETFDCNLNKCKRGNNAYNLLQRMQRADQRGAVRADHGALYARSARRSSKYCAASTAFTASASAHAGVLDFADLEEFAVRLLEEHPETRERVQAQFDHILMDEFQDTNGQQARLHATGARARTTSTPWATSTNRSSASATPSPKASSATRKKWPSAAAAWWS